MLRSLIAIALALPLFGMKPSVHYKKAYDAAMNAGFSVTAAKIIAIGATAPDKYDWGNPAAHGQTPNDDKGYPTMTRDEAVAAFNHYLKRGR